MAVSATPGTTASLGFSATIFSPIKSSSPSFPILIRRRQNSPVIHLPSLIRRFSDVCVFDDSSAGEYALVDDSTIMCEPCNGRGWLVCDFCQGQKTNVKAAESNRVYRRCPSCRATGYMLCSTCKVFKCVTFPDYSDGEETAV